MKPVHIEVGRLTDSGGPLRMNLPKLIDTRLLIQANSGGGKSWMLRVLIERAAPHVQTIVLDSEGEFVSLREKFDFVLASKDEGEVPADPRAAALLARKLMELRVSAVIDLYDLELRQRREFVRLFLDSLLNLPKSLWSPALLCWTRRRTFVRRTPRKRRSRQRQSST